MELLPLLIVSVLKMCMVREDFELEKERQRREELIRLRQFDRDLEL